MREQNPKDKRTYNILPTEKPWQVYPFIQQQIEDGLAQMTQRMSEAEKQEFIRLLMLAAETTLAQEE